MFPPGLPQACLTYNGEGIAVILFVQDRANLCLLMLVHHQRGQKVYLTDLDRVALRVICKSGSHHFQVGCAR